jgi:hypothetical protein
VIHLITIDLHAKSILLKNYTPNKNTRSSMVNPTSIILNMGDELRLSMKRDI